MAAYLILAVAYLATLFFLREFINNERQKEHDRINTVLQTSRDILEQFKEQNTNLYSIIAKTQDQHFKNLEKQADKYNKLLIQLQKDLLKKIAETPKAAVQPVFPEFSKEENDIEKKTIEEMDLPEDTPIISDWNFQFEGSDKTFKPNIIPNGMGFPDKGIEDEGEEIIS